MHSIREPLQPHGPCCSSTGIVGLQGKRSRAQTCICSVLTHFSSHGARGDPTCQEGRHSDGARFSHAKSACVNRKSGLRPTVVQRWSPSAEASPAAMPSSKWSRLPASTRSALHRSRCEALELLRQHRCRVSSTAGSCKPSTAARAWATAIVSLSMSAEQASSPPMCTPSTLGAVVVRLRRGKCCGCSRWPSQDG